MTTLAPTTYVTMGGGGFSMNDGASAFDRYIVELSGRQSPRVCFVGTASGDAESYIENFHASFGGLGVPTTHLSLFQRDEVPIAEHLDRADILYVGGGSTYNLLALWRLHGWLPGSACPHFDGEAARRPVYLDAISGGILPDGLAIDDYAAVEFQDGKLVRCLAEREGAGVTRIVRSGDGVVEEQLAVTYLP